MGTGAGGVDRPKVPSFQGTDPRRIVGHQRLWRLHRVGGLIGRPAGVVTGLEPGSYRTASSHSASAWGHQGVVEGDQTPGQLPASP